MRLLVHDGPEVELSKREVEKGNARQWFLPLDGRGC